MNEQIKLLAEQAGIGYYNLSTGNGDNWRLGGTPEELRKFAELIVRECARSLWTEECHVSDLAVEEYNRNANKIKRHFGVES
jgi:hypothetical protein